MKKAIFQALALALALTLALPLGAAAQTQRVVITAGGDVLLGGSKAKTTDVYFASFIDQYGDGYVDVYKRQGPNRPDGPVRGRQNTLPPGRPGSDDYPQQRSAGL